MKNFLILKNLKRATIGYFKHYVLYDSLRKKGGGGGGGFSISIIILLLNLNKEREGGGPTIAIPFLFLLLKNVTAFTVNI